MKNELKPCPFCGGVAGDHDYGQEYWVKCQECGAQSGSTSSRDAADTWWNIRPSLTQAAPVLLAAAERVFKKLEHPTACVNINDQDFLGDAIAKARGIQP